MNPAVCLLLAVYSPRWETLSHYAVRYEDINRLPGGWDAISEWGEAKNRELFLSLLPEDLRDGVLVGAQTIEGVFLVGANT